MNTTVLKTGYFIRPCQLDDVEAVVNLMNLCSIKVIGEADESVADTLADWQTPGYDQQANQRAVFTPYGQMVGWATIYDSNPIHPTLDIYVHPDYENEGIGEYLFEWCEKRGREMIPQAPPEARVVLWAHTFANDEWYRGFLQRCGMQVVRHYWRMEIEMTAPPASARWPAGVQVYTLQAGEDLRPVLQAERAAFIDHFGYVEEPFEEHFERWSHSWEERFDPHLWFLAKRDEQIVGLALCRVGQGADETLGWIRTVGVRREDRRQGIALALLLTAFDAFYRRDVKRVGLGVDASSLTGATEVYRKAGMSVTLQYDLLEKELRSGIELGAH
jgi:mycothiol synthase